MGQTLEITISSQVIPEIHIFIYLGSKIEDNAEIGEVVSQGVRYDNGSGRVYHGLY